MGYYDPGLGASPLTGYTPTLVGATDTPTVTYVTGKQNGSYRMYGKRCSFDVDLVASGINKVTLSDTVRVSLPAQSAPSPALTRILAVQCENASPLKVGAQAFIPANANYAEIQYNSGGTLMPLTYALLTSLGLLNSNTIIRFGGAYEVA